MPKPIDSTGPIPDPIGSPASKKPGKSVPGPTPLHQHSRNLDGRVSEDLSLTARPSSSRTSSAAADAGITPAEGQKKVYEDFWFDKGPPFRCYRVRFPDPDPSRKTYLPIALSDSRILEETYKNKGVFTQLSPGVNSISYEEDKGKNYYTVNENRIIVNGSNVEMTEDEIEPLYRTHRNATMEERLTEAEYIAKSHPPERTARNEERGGEPKPLTAEEKVRDAVQFIDDHRDEDGNFDPTKLDPKLQATARHHQEQIRNIQPGQLNNPVRIGNAEIQPSELQNMLPVLQGELKRTPPAPQPPPPTQYAELNSAIAQFSDSSAPITPENMILTMNSFNALHGGVLNILKNPQSPTDLESLKLTVVDRQKTTIIPLEDNIILVLEKGSDTIQYCDPTGASIGNNPKYKKAFEEFKMHIGLTKVKESNIDYRKNGNTDLALYNIRYADFLCSKITSKNPFNNKMPDGYRERVTTFLKKFPEKIQENTNKLISEAQRKSPEQLTPWDKIALEDPNYTPLTITPAYVGLADQDHGLAFQDSVSPPTELLRTLKNPVLIAETGSSAQKELRSLTRLATTNESALEVDHQVSEIPLLREGIETQFQLINPLSPPTRVSAVLTTPLEFKPEDWDANNELSAIGKTKLESYAYKQLKAAAEPPPPSAEEIKNRNVANEAKIEPLKTTARNKATRLKTERLAQKKSLVIASPNLIPAQRLAFREAYEKVLNHADFKDRFEPRKIYFTYPTGSPQADPALRVDLERDIQTLREQTAPPPAAAAGAAAAAAARPPTFAESLTTAKETFKSEEVRKVLKPVAEQAKQLRQRQTAYRDSGFSISKEQQKQLDELEALVSVQQAEISEMEDSLTKMNEYDVKIEQLKVLTTELLDNSNVDKSFSPIKQSIDETLAELKETYAKFPPSIDRTNAKFSGTIQLQSFRLHELYSNLQDAEQELLLETYEQLKADQTDLVNSNQGLIKHNEAIKSLKSQLAEAQKPPTTIYQFEVASEILITKARLETGLTKLQTELRALETEFQNLEPKIQAQIELEERFQIKEERRLFKDFIQKQSTLDSGNPKILTDFQLEIGGWKMQIDSEVEELDLYISEKRNSSPPNNTAIDAAIELSRELEARLVQLAGFQSSILTNLEEIKEFPERIDIFGQKELIETTNKALAGPLGSDSIDSPDEQLGLIEALREQITSAQKSLAKDYEDLSAKAQKLHLTDDLKNAKNKTEVALNSLLSELDKSKIKAQLKSLEPNLEELTEARMKFSEYSKMDNEALIDLYNEHHAKIARLKTQKDPALLQLELLKEGGNIPKNGLDKNTLKKMWENQIREFENLELEAFRTLVKNNSMNDKLKSLISPTKTMKELAPLEKQAAEKRDNLDHIKVRLKDIPQDRRDILEAKRNEFIEVLEEQKRKIIGH